MTTIRRVGAVKNMRPFYTLTLQADLLSGWSVVREWGRIGRPGRVRVDPHAELTTAEAAAQPLEARKQRRRYFSLAYFACPSRGGLPCSGHVPRHRG